MKKSAFQVQDQNTSLARSKVVTALADLRTNWENAAKGESLVGINGSVGLLLFDIVGCLGLTMEEMNVLLGTKLSSELNQLMATQSIELQSGDSRQKPF